jgi:hypothetical protein
VNVHFLSTKLAKREASLSHESPFQDIDGDFPVLVANESQAVALWEAVEDVLAGDVEGVKDVDGVEKEEGGVNPTWQSSAKALLILAMGRLALSQVG